jgi:ABC-2 type transport system permease protein
MIEITRKTLIDHKKSLIFWSLGIFFTVLLVMLMWPSVRDMPDFKEYTDQIPGSIRDLFIGSIHDLTSPAGYLNSQLFVLVAPVILIIFSLSWSIRSITQPESSGYLDLLLSEPLKRSHFLLGKAIAWLGGLFVLALVLSLSTLLLGGLYDLSIDPGRVFLASALSMLLALVWGSVVFLLSAWKGAKRRSAIIGAVAALSLTDWLLSGLSQATQSLSFYPDISPYYQLVGFAALAEDPNILYLSATLALIVGLILAGVYCFNKRDLQ